MSKIRIPWAESNIVFLSCTTFQRRPIFRDFITAELLLSALKFYERRKDFLLHAYCVMPDHYHLVMELQRVRSISRILNKVHSSFVTSMEGRGNPAKQRFWSRNAWDVWIRNEEMYWQKVAYTLLNPWRAGLVAHPLDPYPFSNILEWRRRHGDEFMLDMFGQYGRRFE